MAVHALLEVAIRPRRVEAHALLLLEQPPHDRVIGAEPVVGLLGGVHREAAAVHRVHLHIEDFHVGSIEDGTHDGQGVVFKMFVTNRIVAAQPQHRRHIALLEMPDPVIGEHVGDFSGECDRILQIVEHRNRRHDPGGLARDRPEISAEKKSGTSATSSG